MVEESVTADRQPARLLVVESDGRFGPKLSDPMAALTGLRPVVMELSAGRLALDLLKTSQIDVVIADIDCLADLGGEPDERITRLARATADALLVVVRSDDMSISVSLGAMRAGAHDCVCKTVGPAQLCDRIAELARRHGKSEMLLPNSGADAQLVTATPSIPAMRDLVLPMWRQEQRIIESAIQSFAGNIALAAAALELSPSTIYRKRQAWAEMEGQRAEMASIVSAR
jgi:DNA-binding NarL/FixJ family response regulator